MCGEDLLSNLPLSIGRPVGLPLVLFAILWICLILQIGTSCPTRVVLFAGIEPARLLGVACCYGFPHLLPFRCVVRILNSSPAMAAT